MSDIEKIWYILLNDQQLGPYSFYDLRSNPEVTQDTLAWRDGLSVWKPIKEIPELSRLFEEGVSLHETDVIAKRFKQEEAELTATLSEEPPFWFLWILVIVLLLIWLFFSLVGDSQ